MMSPMSHGNNEGKKKIFTTLTGMKILKTIQNLSKKFVDNAHKSITQ